MLIIPNPKQAIELCKTSPKFSYTRKTSGTSDYLFVGYRDANPEDFLTEAHLNMRELMFITDNTSNELVMTHPGHGKFFEEESVQNLPTELQPIYTPEPGEHKIVYFRKLDGSSLTSFIHPITGSFRLRTPGSVSNSLVDDTRELVTKEMSRLGHVLNELEEPAFLCFEYVSPTNTIIEFYDEPKLIVTQIRRFDGSYYTPFELTDVADEYPEVEFNLELTYRPDMSVKIEGYVGVYTNVLGYTSFSKHKTKWYENIHGNKLNCYSNVSKAWIARSYLNNNLGYLIGYISTSHDLTWIQRQTMRVAKLISNLEEDIKLGDLTHDELYKKYNNNTKSNFSLQNIVHAWYTGRFINNHVYTDTSSMIMNYHTMLDTMEHKMYAEVLLISKDWDKMKDDDRGSFFAKYKGNQFGNSLIKQKLVPGKGITRDDVSEFIFNRSNKYSPKKFHDLVMDYNNNR